MPRPNPVTACEDFHRTAGTPRHPDVGVTRRHFLGWGIAGGLSLYTARAAPLGRWLEGAADAAAQAPDAPMLVVVFLPGGLDLLDTLVPLAQYGPYADGRGGTAQPQATSPELGNTGVGIHKALTTGDGGGIKGLYDRGRIGFLPGIDYANPDLSHFHSRHFWETGLITAAASSGWLGRWLDAYGRADNPFQGVTSGFRLSPTLASGGAPVSSIENVRDAELAMAGLSGAAFDRAMTAWTDLAYPRRKDGPGRGATRTAARLAQDVADKLRPLRDAAPAPQTQGGDLPITVPGTQTQSGYPAGVAFADRLRQLAFLMSQPLGVRIATVDVDGNFDTHGNQRASLDRLLTTVSQSLAAFQADIEARGLADRVLTFVWSEFGRRLKANDSLGTDHGAGGVGWVQGARAANGILTEYPNLRALDGRGNLQVTVDFRQVYASLVEQWLGTPADPVIPDAGAFGRVQVVR
jgi:uncharacterized protein (DUF1501 family)